MLRIALCDDDNKTINVIEDYIEKIDYKILDYDSFSSGDNLLDYCRRNEIKYDVYFLDIEMPGSNGMETARKIREGDSKAILVFLTSHSEFMEQAFEVQTFRFLKKPVTYEKFNGIMKEIADYFYEVKTKLFYQYDKEYYNLDCDSIVFIEKENRLLRIHMENGELYTCNMALNEVHDQLNKKIFVKSYPSIIVNMEFIKTIKKDVVILDDKKELPLSRRNKYSFRQAFLEYVKERMCHS